MLKRQRIKKSRITWRAAPILLSSALAFSSIAPSIVHAAENENMNEAQTALEVPCENVTEPSTEEPAEDVTETNLVDIEEVEADPVDTEVTEPPTENDPELSPRVISKALSDAEISISGDMPEDVYVTAVTVNADDYEITINEDLEDQGIVFYPLQAFDINILYENGIKYQPVDKNETVTVSITADMSEADEVSVYRITDEGTITRLNANKSSDNTVSFETDHFSTYVVGEEFSAENYGITTFNTHGLPTVTTSFDGLTVNYYSLDGTVTITGTHTASFSGNKDTRWYTNFGLTYNDIKTNCHTIECNFIPYAGGDDFSYLFCRFSSTGGYPVSFTFSDDFVNNSGNIINMSGMFYGCGFSSSSSLDVSNWNTANVTDMSHMFDTIDGGGCLTSIDVSNWNTEKVKDMSFMFYKCASLSRLDVGNWDVSNVENMSYMFADCQYLYNALDVKEWKVDKVKDMSYMFYGCANLPSLDLQKWKTGNVNNMHSMFQNCSYLSSLNIDNWDVSNVTNMNGMFSGCYRLNSLNINSWNVDKVTTMAYMFKACKQLNSIDLSSWKVNEVTAMNHMFSNCSSLSNINMSGWNTENLQYTSYMFENCTSLITFDLGNLNLSLTSDASNMFSGCTNLHMLKTPVDNRSYIDLPMIYYLLDGTTVKTDTTYTRVLASNMISYTLVNEDTHDWQDNICSICGAHKVCNHNYVETNRTEATCTTDGAITYTCQKCGDSYTDSISFTGHTAGSPVRENEISATCDTGGSYDEVTYCKTCHAELDRQTFYTNATDHTWSDWQTTLEPTCTTDGSEQRFCQNDSNHVETRPISQTGHTLGSPIRENEVSATCDAGGSYDEVTYCETWGLSSKVCKFFFTPLSAA